LQVVAEEKLKFLREKDMLVYSMPISSKIVPLEFPMERLALSKYEQIESQNLQLREKVAQLEAAFDEKCKENSLCLQAIDALQLKISQLSL
jgi:hypothetical protein